MNPPVLTTAQYDALSDYERGFVDGLHAYAWWKNGTQYVGTTGTTFRMAVERFLRKGGPKP